MTLKEIKQAIAQSPSKDWYQSFSIDIKYPYIAFNKTITGVVNIYEFVFDQVEGFGKIENLPQEIETVRNRFVGVKNNIIQLVQNNDVDERSWKTKLANITSQTSNPLNYLYDSPELELLINLSRVNQNYYKGAREFFGGTLNNMSNKDYFIGYLLANEVFTKEILPSYEKKDSEKRSLRKLKEDFGKNIEESNKQVVEFISNANEKSLSYSKNIDDFKEQKEKRFTEWFEQVNKTFEEFNTTSLTKVTEIETLYKEKLKLEAPAKYWNDRATKLRKEGYRWLTILVICVIIGIAILIWTLNEIAVGTLDKIFQNVGTGVKWSVLFITLVSFIAFAIKIFSKLTFSSFHLVRDAEEREQLTYVYLALQKEKGIDDTERHLIMQSLFSRVDTGLLKDDGGPTMPGQIIDQVAKK